MDKLENKHQRIKELFKAKPYLIGMGANTVAKMYSLDPQDIRNVRSYLRNKKKREEPKKQARILIVDIETSPLRAYVWRRWKQNIYLDQTISEWFMICWAAKWLGDEDIMSDCITPREVKHEDDARITRSLWGLLEEADIVIAHNGKKFDIPKMNSRFILNGLPPTSPYKQIDTKEVAARQFGFSSNKLDALAGYFDIEHKDDTDFKLWVDCIEGKQDALDYMLKYNEKDVIILEKVYLKLRPWIKAHPNVAVYQESDQKACSSCGSLKMVEDEHFYYTNVNKYKLYRCEDCGAFSRVRTTAYPKDKKANLLVSTA